VLHDLCFFIFYFPYYWPSSRSVCVCVFVCLCVCVFVSYKLLPASQICFLLYIYIYIYIYLNSGRVHAAAASRYTRLRSLGPQGVPVLFHRYSLIFCLTTWCAFNPFRKAIFSQTSPGTTHQVYDMHVICGGGYMHVICVHPVSRLPLWVRRHARTLSSWLPPC